MAFEKLYGRRLKRWLALIDMRGWLVEVLFSGAMNLLGGCSEVALVGFRVVHAG